MGLRNLIIYVILLAGTIDVLVVALTCKPCLEIHGKVIHKKKCPPINNCKGGLTISVCGCCERCASVMGEYCGGTFGVNGRCDEQLVCVVKERTYRLARHHEVGRCVPVEISTDDDSKIIERRRKWRPKH